MIDDTTTVVASLYRSVAVVNYSKRPSVLLYELGCVVSLNANLGGRHIVIAIGEVNLDISFVIEEPFTALTADRTIYAPVQYSVGGTSGNFALAAINHFAHVKVLTRLGDDAIARYLIERLNLAGVDCCSVVDHTRTTRTVVRARGVDLSSGADARLMVVDPDSPAYWLEAADVDRVAWWFETAHLLMVDTYSMLAESSQSAAMHAMSIAKEAGCAVVVDVVPHKIYQLKSLSDVQLFTRQASILIFELKTLQRLLGIETEKSVLDFKDALCTIVAARDAFPCTHFLLRYGLGHNDETLIDIGAMDIYSKSTGFSVSQDKDRFGDRLAAAELSMLLSGMSPEGFGYKTHSR